MLYAFSNKTLDEKLNPAELKDPLLQKLKKKHRQSGKYRR